MSAALVLRRSLNMRAKSDRLTAELAIASWHVTIRLQRGHAGSQMALCSIMTITWHIDLYFITMIKQNDKMPRRTLRAIARKEERRPWGKRYRTIRNIISDIRCWVTFTGCASDGPGPAGNAAKAGCGRVRAAGKITHNKNCILCTVICLGICR